MPAIEKNQYRDRLRDMRDRMLGEVDSVVESINEDLNPAGNNSNAPVHLADAAPENIVADIGVIESERGVMEEIQAAIRRIDDGSFGTCIDCGQPISPERLDAIPYAARCIECASKNGSNPIPAAMDRQFTTRRAGQLDDELRPGQSNVPDDAAAGRNAVGTPGGGLASGGLAGTNAADGSPDDADLDSAMTSGIYDHSGDKEDDEEPESGPGGGAAGGTPAGKRSGRRMRDPR